MFNFQSDQNLVTLWQILKIHPELGQYLSKTH